jgi:hypothetical protein
LGVGETGWKINELHKAILADFALDSPVFGIFNDGGFL